MEEKTETDAGETEPVGTSPDDATTIEEAEALMTPDAQEAEENVEAATEAHEPKKALWKRPFLMVPVALLLAVMVTMVVLAQPSEPEPDFVPDARSTELYFLLADAGIVDAVVDVQEEYVLVRYNIPEGADPEEVLYRVLGTTYGSVSDVDQVILQVYADYSPVEQITIEMEDVTLFIRGFIDQATFESGWSRR